MSRIASALAKRKALITYVTVGYPSVEATLDIVPALAGWGCDMVELGIPFSDPLADGATIQQASHRALLNGVTPEVCLDVASKLRQKTDVPLLFMTYYNPVFNFGLEAFCLGSAEAGIDGLIVPDLPPEEGYALEGLASQSGMDVVYLIAPNSSEERVDLVARRSRGFIYIVTVTGVTGARQQLPAGFEDFVARVRKRTTLPLCVGFGISNADQARWAASLADGVIVGSRIIELLDGHPPAELREFVGGMRNALDSC